MEESLPYSQASENNKHAILDVLRRHVADRQSLLEIAGGTGQHAVFFAGNFPNLLWQSSDIPEVIDTLNRRLKLAKLPNLPAAIALDVDNLTWTIDTVDCIYSANSLHIMSAASVEKFFTGVARHLAADGLLMVYGPFKYDGDFTTPSNARFDLWLKERNAESGIRDFEWVNSLAAMIGMTLDEDNAMPANNQLLVWRRGVESRDFS